MSTRDGSSLVGGRVEICNDGRYGSVCDLNWDNDDAQVACTNFFGQASDYVFGMSYLVCTSVHVRYNVFHRW